MKIDRIERSLLTALLLGLLSLNSVRAQSDRIAMAVSAAASVGVVIREIDAQTYEGLGLQRQDQFVAGYTVVLTPTVAQALQTEAGDKITLIEPTGRQTPFGPTPAVKIYKVAAIATLDATAVSTVYLSTNAIAGLLGPTE